MGRPPPPPPVFRADTSGPPGLQPASACEKQLTQLQRHVLAFCERVTPGLKNGSYDWLTHVTDVDPRNMAKNIMYALQWGQRDASHGLLFTKRSFVKMNSTLLLWSGVSPSVRAKWCTSLNMFMLHAGGNDDIQTPFGGILEEEGMKSSDGRPLHDCEWAKQEPIWQSASDAVVWRNGADLVRFLVKKPLVKEKWTLQRTVFFRSELPTLARYPPARGFRVLNEHPHVRCHHLMPLIRGKIEETGLLEDWQKVETFSCVNVAEMEHPETAEQTELKSFESKATEFLKPGEKITQDCRFDKVTKERYPGCLAMGHIELELFREVANQLPPSYEPHLSNLRLPALLKQYGPQVVTILPDVMEMFDTVIALELYLVQFTQGPDKDAFQELARPGLEDLPEALPLLEKALYSDHDAGVAAANALEPLAKEEPEKVLPCLLKRPRGDSSGRHLLLLALLKSIGQKPPETGVPMLHELLTCPDWQIRIDVIQLLQKIAPKAPAAVATELNHIIQNDSENYVRLTAADALKDIQTGATEGLPLSSDPSNQSGPGL
ncbi:Deoxyhypusine hydroxylase [Durusdinium trenchii]|uniref:Deoxyhypusine hydroxylase n=1 Tax=Durusdinium trenchii TaxID=1381693 RepID=A0ABP0IG14_9DINO